MKKLAELDESYWAYKHPDINAANAKFLARHKTAGSYDFGGLKLTCPSGIYQPHEFGSTRFAIRGLYNELPNLGSRVLELGTGSGAIGLWLANAGLDVTVLDIDGVAVECAKNNAVANNVSVTALQSDLFSAVSNQKFDTLFFNIPLQDKPIEDPLEIISCDFGGELLTRFLMEAPDYLQPNGRVYVSVSNIGNRTAMLSALSSYENSIVHAEYYASTRAWRWLLAAKPLDNSC